MRDVKHSKSILARLMASENINVEHVAGISTASFNLSTRTLRCPVWVDMEGDLYDLLMGHEVGHALETPAQGWHDALDETTNKNFKSFLNVVEDARIEKKMKRKFPGLRKSFYSGYSSLLARDFFGLKDTPEVIDQLNVIDRINIHFKVGSLMGVKFSTEEQKYVDRIENIETWDEVVAISKELYEYSKENEKDKINNLKDLQDLLDMLKDALENGEFGDGESDGEGESIEDMLEGMGLEGDELKEKLKELMKQLADKKGSGDGEDPSSVTDSAFRAKEKELLDNPANAPLYLDIPTSNLENIILHSKCVMDSFYKSVENSLRVARGYGSQLNVTVQDIQNVSISAFNRQNNRYIALLVKNFEMHKNANQYARERTSRSGELDTKKLHSYKIVNDVFRKITTVDKGKSHGMILFLDMSSSMWAHFAKSVEQILILVAFCKRVGIPFEVYGFADGIPPDKGNLGLGPQFNYTERSFKFVGVGHASYSKSFHLKDLINSDMSPNTYRRAFSMMMMAGNMIGSSAAEYYMDYKKFRDAYISIDPSTCGFNLHSTPYNQTTIASIEIIKKFRNKYRNDIMNVVYVTDGEGNQDMDVPRDNLPPTWTTSQGRYVFTDPKTKISVKCQGMQACQNALTDLVQKITGVKHIGFFLCAYTYNLRSKLRERNHSIVDESTLRGEGYFESNVRGYDSYYFIDTSFGTNTKDLSFNDKDMSTSGRMAKKFAKNQTLKHATRIILAKFAKKVAA